MIYQAPPLSSADEQVLTKINELREDLRFLLVSPRRWYGTLRRAVFARAVQGSNSIEGYHASVEDVAAVIEEEEPMDTQEETRQAISCYRDAMTYVLQAAKSKRTIDSSLLLALHYMIMKYDLGKNPGQWRPGANQVVDQDGRIVYTAPDREWVEELVEETLDDISRSEHPVMVTAAMAHLNLALVHPWSDGNGRMARCLQTLVLATERTPDPVFSSIEEYLGRNTPRYYAVLAEVNDGQWSPWRDTRPWIEFCLTAHYRQGRTLQRRIEQFEALWNQCEHLAALHRLPDRVVDALADAARGRTLWRSLYVKITRSSLGEKISDTQGTRDLLSMHRAGLLEAVGAKRGRRYRATPELSAVWGNIRTQRPSMRVEDPYEDISRRRLPSI
ncbi:MAG: Fic family protein [bacterium]|nr:Fic family protein [bacterium]MDE0500985.1 Fic family protein [bacterium]